MKDGDLVVVKSKENPIRIHDRNGSADWVGERVIKISNVHDGTCTVKGLYCGADVDNIPLGILRLATEEEIKSRKRIL